MPIDIQTLRSAGWQGSSVPSGATGYTKNSDGSFTFNINGRSVRYNASGSIFVHHLHLSVLHIRKTRGIIIQIPHQFLEEVLMVGLQMLAEDRMLLLRLLQLLQVKGHLMGMYFLILTDLLLDCI